MSNLPVDAPLTPPRLPSMEEAITRHQAAVSRFFAAHGEALETLTGWVGEAFAAGGKLLLCGNGGSACDAMHIAGEFVGRFQCERRALPALALSADSGILSAVGNDYGFEQVFARQVAALGRPGDILIALSTSGHSPNIVQALETARAQQLKTVLLTGEKGQHQHALADLLLWVEETDTARIQEVHMLALHILAGQVESRLDADRS